MDIVSYYIEPCIGIREIDFDNRHCNYKISRKSFAPECRNNCCRTVRDGRMVKSCTHDSTESLSSVVSCDNEPTTNDVSSFSYSAACCLDVRRMVCPLPPFERIRRPKKTASNAISIRQDLFFVLL